MPTYKLSYFNVKGRAEAARYLLAMFAAGDYEDCRVERDHWEKVKSNYKFAQLPMLEVGGEQIFQSMAITRFLADKFGVRGSTAEDRALVDMYVYGVEDAKAPAQAWALATLTGDEAKAKDEWQKYKEGALKTGLPQFEKSLADNGTGFLVGKSMTWADIHLAEFLHRQLQREPTILDGYPLLKKLMDTVHEHPGLQKYIASRPVTKL